MKNTSSQAINTTNAFNAGADMSERENEIIEDILRTTNFKSEEIIWRSSYWGTSQIGAVHYRGKFNGKPAVLKIQGVKPDVSETDMIRHFAEQNRSKIVRSPILFQTIPWVDKKGFEALIMEYVPGPKLLESKRLQTKENIHEFYEVYKEYRINCLPLTPWLPRPKPLNYREVLEKLITTSDKAYPNDSRKKSGDIDLAKQAYEVLVKVYSERQLEFMHGHFSVEDLLRSGEQVVIFSNLFWKYRAPFFDAIFGYHWFMFELGHIDNITPDQIEKQRSLWLKEIFSLPFIVNSPENTLLIKAALLERATAGFILDSLLIDPKKTIATYLTESCRDQAKKLITDIEHS